MLEIVNQNLKLGLPVIGIERCHRIGQITAESRPIPIIVKFSNYNFREQVFKNKKMLKGTGTVIREDLCDGRLVILKECRSWLQKCVWTKYSIVFLKSK